MIFESTPADVNSSEERTTERSTERVAFILAGLGAFLLLSVGLVWGWMALNRALYTENPAYHIRSVEVRNYAGLVSKETVLRQLELTPQDLAKGVNLYAINLTLQRQAFLQDYPGIQGFTLERYPPDRLVIVLQERNPLARLGNRTLVVDEEGYVFTLPPNREYLLDTLPMLISEGFADMKPGSKIREQEQAAISLLRTKRLQNPQLAFTIAEVDLTGDVFLDFITDGNVCVRLPYQSLSTDSEIGRSLRLAAATLASGRVAPGQTLEVQPGERGRESKVFLR